VGDRVVSIDGGATAERSGEDLRQIFVRPPGTTVRVELCRDDRRVETSLTLGELLP